MEYVIFAVAGEGHFTNIGEEYGRAMKSMHVSIR